MIKYKKGDATLHKEGMLVHCVNDCGYFGAGISGVISNRYPEVEKQYREWAKNGFFLDGKKKIPFLLGYTQNIQVTKDLWVSNLVGQRDVKYFYDLPPVRYQSLMEGLIRVREFMKNKNLKTLVSGRICAGLAGGKWDLIEKIIEKTFDKSNINVIIYDINPEEWPDTVYEN